MAKASTPAKPVQTPGKPDREQEMLMREVDEAVRQDQATTFAKKYGVPLGIAIVLLLAAFGGYLFWQNQTESRLQGQSEGLVQALDELEAGNAGIADTELSALTDGDDGAAAMATMMRAGIAAERGQADEAATLFNAVADNGELPAEIRDIAAIRAVTAQYDDLQPQAVIDRLGPLAQPDNPYYGSAGELVAHAYLALGQRDQAGPLLVAISKNENVPQSIRSRTRQLAGSIGFDAIEDVDAALAELVGDGPGAPGAAQQTAAQPAE
ncbi:tetratricopeptide repeat protein [Aurantiacibacter aquimixticola]|uniref:Ancillary SecYEG translocon subunit/Cell division coordinator CpoB TPR domain-containing protein n=1 Tax=Aurantiacibacter aquimixticola TaxID=1958945 RepID=A0A419RQI6_9SPHN|nr:tetratricopeptide repeat protein [Aurantiacibacter aquimixticola]RJY08025.1 hypothetical protein D6201_00440 [Aurantiacibacter aquimixticola]